MQKIYPVQKQHLKDLPQTPGVYIYFNKLNIPIYVGKARNLKNRVSSYFSSQVIGPKTSKMMQEAQMLKVLTVGSEFEALLLEAQFIRTYKPKYNTASKDDKTPCYIAITQEKYPRVLITRKSNLNKGFVVKNVGYKQIFGPFQSAHRTRQLLRVLRRIFPFCQQRLAKKPCLYSQMGLCEPCPSYIERLDLNDPAKKELKSQYLKNIRKIRSVLSGKIKTLQRQIEKEMALYTRAQKYEEAQKIKQQIDGLNWLRRPIFSADEYIDNPNLVEDVRKSELDSLLSLLAPQLNIKLIRRIECFDVSHLAGSEPTASMVTLTNGQPDKKHYRHFKIRSAKKADDIAAMQEVVSRRVKHFEDWGKPDLVIIDGGKGQLGAAVEFFKKESIPVVGLEKKTESLVIKRAEGFMRLRVPEGPALHIVQRARDEAHRFARRLHHKRLAKALLATYDKPIN